MRNALAQVLVLMPTRELAQQAHGVMKTLAARLPSVRAALVVGGVSSAKQDAELCSQAQIIVGTPGTAARRQHGRRSCTADDHTTLCA